MTALRRRVATWLVRVLAGVLLGCEGAAPPPRPLPDVVPPLLPKSVDPNAGSARITARELDDFVRGIRGSSGVVDPLTFLDDSASSVRVLRAAGATGAETTTVSISPESRVRLLSTSQHLATPGRGRVIAKLQNEGSAADFRFHIPPNHSVLWVVEPRTSGSTGRVLVSFLVEYSVAAGTVTTYGPFAFSYCPHGTAHPSSRADFRAKDCTAAALAGARRAAARAPDLRLTDDPPWVTCELGCCTLG